MLTTNFNYNGLHKCSYKPRKTTFNLVGRYYCQKENNTKSFLSDLSHKMDVYMEFKYMFKIKNDISISGVNLDIDSNNYFEKIKNVNQIFSEHI